MNTIHFEQVTKNYGKVQGISNVTLSLEPGVTGILGPNGAGKSTTMKVILGLTRPSIGTVSVNGVNPFDDLELRKNIGFVPEYDCFYEHMSAVEYVSYFLMIHDFNKEESIDMAQNSLRELGLQDSMHRKIRTYSRGMRQKTKVARATAFNPQILVLDEPFQGADPTTRHLLMEKIKSWSDEGKTILISSHILHDVEYLTDNIILINNGRVLASGNRHEIRKLMSNIPIQIKVSPIDKKQLRPLIKRMLDEKWITAGRLLESEGEIILETNESEKFYTKFPQILENEKIIVERIVSDDDTLDSLYSKLVEGKQWK
ncbi:MAG: hypothetical protein BEU00_01815 [Marine Group III euryarchaeote CG-Epi3]|jgi:ABC-2 type transport system ATP-binding protein|uniref:ABC transporter domain-containing protein n=1 Tax=Marine Group III euryarchaeote CG-Epi3 TaxID=1888997 RepID=A0A1J5U2V9_9ARCH|nr:MAG: hypothetical protein BEU00_01815 [Marine Group III euryarchaeote CG-Epi3]|tara:strand:- start:3159 stop:4103 length:945 start_codon:yes stop_codon:yes gene_type:complete